MLFILAGCWAATAVTHEAWYTGELCKAHRGEKYQAALVKQGLPRDCGACHGGDVLTLSDLREGFPGEVQRGRCMQCHRTDILPAKNVEGEGFPPTPGREGRKAHLGDPSWKPRDYEYGQVGLSSVDEGTVEIVNASVAAARVPLACQYCHPEHLGPNFTQKGDVFIERDEGAPQVVRRQVRLEAPCVRCHLPAGMNDLRPGIRAAFVKAHGPAGAFAKPANPSQEVTGTSSPAAILALMHVNRYTCNSCHGEHHRRRGNDAKEEPD